MYTMSQSKTSRWVIKPQMTASLINSDETLWRPSRVDVEQHELALPRVPKLLLLAAAAKQRNQNRHGGPSSEEAAVRALPCEKCRRKAKSRVEKVDTLVKVCLHKVYYALAIICHDVASTACTL
jgi:hypothetical protein